jgi:L-asparaginase
MRKSSLALLVLLAGAALAPVSAQSPAVTPPASPSQPIADAAHALPRVRLIATGGTISNRRGGRLTADELVAAVPGLGAVARVQAEQFANVASSELTLEQWLALARRINAALQAEPDLAGIVVTSGTDTLEELAYFLHLTVRDRRPVIVTGAMRNPDQVGHDGPANLLSSVRAAATPDAGGRGVLVVLNDEINGARDVTKADALRLHTFVSRGFGSLGVVDGDRVVFRRMAEGRHTAASEFDVSELASLPRVDVLLVYQDAPGDLVRAAVDAGTRGIVIAAAGAGATSGTQREALLHAAARGIPVVTTTRTGTGRIAPRTRPAAPDEPARIAAGDLSPVKARILLMLALTRTTDAAELQRIFEQY